MVEIFVEREFELRENEVVVARIFRPVQREVDFRCDYEIVWPDRTRRFAMHGIDGVQALIHALKIVRVELISSPEGKLAQIRWVGMEDLGLPDI